MNAHPLPRPAVIVAARRTPIGTAGRGLREVLVAELAAPVLRAVLSDAGASADEVADVVLGNVMGPGGNPARVAALQAGFGERVPGLTVDRQCGSGLEAINLAATLVASGRGPLLLAGGVESASTAPIRTTRPTRPGEQPTTYDRAPFAPAHIGDPEMGVAAETVAREAGVIRERQDAYAAESHRRAVAGQKSGGFAAEIVPIGGLDRDERPRARLTVPRLGRLPAAFVAEGSVTAGNSCGVSDGAAVVAVASEEWRQERGLPGLRVVDWEVAGVDPNRCGIGIVPAVRALLDRHDLAVTDIGAIEVTEAFAGQVLACLDALGLEPGGPDRDRVCSDGGAIALGHPWGASGAVLVVRLFTRMVRKKGPRFGLAACAVGGGMGVATLVERVE